MVMKIQFTELIQSDFSGQICDDGWFPIDEIDLVDGPDGLITVGLAGSDKALVTGTMMCAVSFSCDRCCKTVRLDLTAEFNYECIVGSEEVDEVRHETECREEDLNRIYLKEPIIDIGALCREQLFLALPSRVLCDDLCKGLCLICGADLNKNQCGCETDTSASPFSILSKLSDR